MSDHRGLIGRLETIAASDSSIQDGWRSIGEALDRDPLAALLREIDETQLPRELNFRNDQGHTLRLEAGNRRLRRILSVSCLEPDAVAAVSEKDLATATEAEIEAIGVVFRTVQSGDQTIRVRCKELPSVSEGSFHGIPAVALARAWSIDLNVRSDENLHRVFENFVKALAPLAGAWLRYENGELSEVSQPKPDAEWRDGWNSVDLSQFRNSGDPIKTGPALCVLGSGIEGEAHHFVATFAATSVVFYVNAADVTEISQSWRDLGL